ncbi:MAG TPA: hypothetical protein VEL03_07065 [Streptosporangiaceae bacterium]|nr:hypothetical protein [Streptosporangiaceae bacterium]
MKTATSLGLVAVGAIFAFAITRSPSFLNLQVVGWVLMLTGGVGAIIPRRGSGWLRRRVVVRDEEATEDETARTAPQPQRFSRLLVPGGLLSSRHPSLQSAGRVEQETIEEYVEE